MSMTDLEFTSATTWNSDDDGLPDYIDPDYIETEYERHSDGMVSELTEHEMQLVAEVLCRFIDRDIDRRGIRGTYKPECLSVMAYDLWHFAMEMQSCVDGDNVDLAREAASVARESIDELESASGAADS